MRVSGFFAAWIRNRIAYRFALSNVTLENGRLIYRRDGLPQSWALVPLGNDTFVPEGLGDIRIRLTAEPGGRATKLVILAPEGVQGESPRDGS